MVRGVAVEDEPRGQADDPAGSEPEQGSLAGGELVRGDQGRDPPAGLAGLAPDLAPGEVLGPLLGQVGGHGGGRLGAGLGGVADDLEVEHPLGGPDPVHRVEQQGQRAGLPLLDQPGQARRVADQARGRVEHRPALDLAEPVVLEGDPRAGQVDDDVGDPQGRVQFEGPVGVDQLVVIDAPLAEVGLGQGRVLGRDAEGPARVLELGGQVDQVDDVGDVDPALGDGDDQPAAAVAEVVDDDGRLPRPRRPARRTGPSR